MIAGQRNVIAVGASAGGVEALRALVGGLPADFHGAMLVVLHVPRDAPSALPAILTRAGALPATTAVDGEPLRTGHIYVAPSDRHMIVLGEQIRLDHGPAEHGHRPAVDPLFRSVARAFGPRAIGVVLSGARDDGASGLATIAAYGGRTIVQDPADARYPWMPRAALRQVVPDQLAPADAIGGIITAMTARPPAEVALSGPDPFAEMAVTGPELTHIVESALWVALQALEEKAAFSHRMAETRMSRQAATGLRFQDIADDAEAAGATIRRIIAWINAVGVDTRPAAARPDAPSPEVR